MPVQGLDIAAWLRDLGLERYAPAFGDAEVTPEALQELTDTDLRGLGLPLGPRKLVLKAIRDLAGPCALAAPGRGGAAAADGDVLRPGRLDRAEQPPRSRGPARGHRGLPRLRGRGRAAARRFSGQVPGRRRARLLRLATGARGRRRTRDQVRACAGGGRRPARPRLAAAAGARRRRHGLGGRGRPRRLRGGAGTRRGGRDAQSRRPAASRGRARHRRHRGVHPPAHGKALRLPRPRRRAGERLRRAGPGVAGPRRERGREPFRGATPRPDAAGRTRGGVGAAAPPVAAGQKRGGPRRAPCRRAGHRQVTARRRAAGEGGGRASRLRALLLLAAPRTQPVGTRGRPARARGGFERGTRPSGNARSWRR